MKYKFTRVEARVLPEFKGKKNVVREVVVGLTGVDEESGLGAYRDTLIALPEPGEADFIAFEDIDEDWTKPICERASVSGEWEASIASEIEAAKSRPVVKPFAWQPQPEVEV